MVCKDLRIKGAPYFVPPTEKEIITRSLEDLERIIRNYLSAIDREIEMEINDEQNIPSVRKY